MKILNLLDFYHKRIELQMWVCQQFVVSFVKGHYSPGLVAVARYDNVSNVKLCLTVVGLKLAYAVFNSQTTCRLLLTLILHGITL